MTLAFIRAEIYAFIQTNRPQNTQTGKQTEEHDSIGSAIYPEPEYI